MPEPPSKVIPAAETPSETPEHLLARLPTVPEVSIQDHRVVWSGEGASIPITGIDDATSDPLLATASGPIRVTLHALLSHCTRVVPQVPALVQAAIAAHLSLSDLVVEDGMITGPSLRNDEVIVLPEGVMRKQAVATNDHQAQINHLTLAVAVLKARTSTATMGPLNEKALHYVLDKLDHPDGNEAIDDFTPSFARRAVRHGWMRLWYHGPGDDAPVAAVEAAVAAAEQHQPVLSFQGQGLRLEHVEDAFGSGGWLLSTSAHRLFAHTDIHPEFLGQIAELITVIELPSTADPLTQVDQAISATVYQGMNLLASWSAAKGFVCDTQNWYHSITIAGSDLIANAIPPHIILSGLNGDIAALAVPRGVLRTVQDSSHHAAERFIEQAAQVLHDGNELDLIGEYLFNYVYPSPDAAFPQLMGNRQLKSDVQQTVWQICANTVGGVMHGDCADIAELYQTITQKQQHNAIIIGLPEHAACAWAEKKDGLWHVDVLQTGPPLEFSDAELAHCLEKTYRRFDPGMAFDANGLPLLLRFSGEVSRSEWSLSWRIFSEPDYAKTMIEVEQDWHYETYQRGIATMQKIIAAGDTDNANYRELSGLYSFTGQYALAAEYSRKAIAHTNDPVSRLHMSVHLISHLLSAGKIDEASALATDIITSQLPPLKAKLGASYLQVVLELAATCLNEEGDKTLKGMATSLLKDVLNQPLSEYVDRLSDYLSSPDFNQNAWDQSSDLHSIRFLVSSYCRVGREIISRLDAAHGLDADTMAVAVTFQRWLDGIAFHDIEENNAVLVRYADAGLWYEALLGQKAFDVLLDEAPMAVSSSVKHSERLNGVAQMRRDLPWIRASVPYWYQRMTMLLRPSQEAIDPILFARLAKHLQDAHAATTALGLANPRCEIQTILGAELAALIAHDDHALRLQLHVVATMKDKGLRDLAAQMLGDTARFLDMTWYAKVLEAWRDEVDYKPKYFWIAWRAALNKAPAQALMAARMASERFKDDPAFTEEYGFMRSLLAPDPHAKSPAIAPGAGH